MAALSSVRFNLGYEKILSTAMERKKLKKVALVTVMRKMLVILNSLMANRVPFEVREI
jgi:hypothetical protein